MTQTQGTSEGSEFRAKFEAALEENKQIPTLKQENTLLKLGIKDPDAGKAKLFRDAYKGEWDVESVKKAISEYGLDDLLSAPAEQQQVDPAAQAKAQEAAAMQRMAGAAAGAPTLPGSGEDLDFSDCSSEAEVMAKLAAAGRPIADFE